jgi:hypothetical protein
MEMSFLHRLEQGEVRWCRCFLVGYKGSGELDAENFERRLRDRIEAVDLEHLDVDEPLTCDFCGVQEVSRDGTEYYVLVVFSVEVAVVTDEELRRAFDICDGSKVQVDWSRGTGRDPGTLCWKGRPLGRLFEGPSLGCQRLYVYRMQSCIDGRVQSCTGAAKVDGGSSRDCVMIGRRLDAKKSVFDPHGE